MKKILALMLLLSLSLALLSCGKDGNKDKGEATELPNYENEGLIYYGEMGFYYALPEAFKRENLSYGDVVFVDNKSGYFYFVALDEEELGEDWIMAADTTAKDFAQFLVNDLSSKSELKGQAINLEYDSNAMIAEFDYVWTYPEEEALPAEYYRHVVVRNSVYLYVITLSCHASDKASYEQVFDRIIETIIIEEPAS